MRREENKA